MNAGSKDGLRRHTIAGMLWMTWSSGANALLRIGVLIALTRLLTPADFGVVNAALIVIAFAGGIAQLGLGPALVQRPEIDARHEHTAFVASFLFSVAMALLVVVGAPTVASFYHMPTFERVLRVLAWYFPIRGLSITSECLLQRQLRFRWLANLEVATYALGYGLVGITGAILGWGVWALIAAQLAQITLKSVVLLIAQRPRLRGETSWRALQDLLGFGASYASALMAILLANQLDNIVVIRWLGAAASGFYGRAYQLMAVPGTLLGDVLDGVLFPTLARVQDDRPRLAAAYLRASALIALVMLPAGAVLAALAPEIIRILFGERWLAVIPIFQTFAFAMVLRANYRMSDSLARAVGSRFERVWRQTLYALLVLVGALIGQRRGVEGVAIGVFVALTVNYLLMAQLALQLADARWRAFWAVHMPGVVCAMVAGGVTWGVIGGLRTWGLPLLPRVALTAVVVATLAVAAAWRFPRLLGRDGEWLLGVLREMIVRRLQPSGARSAEA